MLVFIVKFACFVRRVAAERRRRRALRATRWIDVLFKKFYGTQIINI